MRVTCLIDNKTESVSCVSEWGLSLLLEIGNRTYLYDMGSSDIFLNNAERLGVDLTEVEATFVSHGHFDHTGGAEGFCNINKTSKIYIHKDAFKKVKPLYPNGEVEDLECGILWSDEFKNSISNRLVLTDGITKITDDLTLVSNIPSLKEYPLTERFVSMVDGNLVVDQMDHEQFLVVDEDAGITIISGCSHKGMIPTIKYAKELFPNRKVKGYIGGLHTYMLNKKERLALIEKLKELEVEKIYPMHCTGINMIVDLKALIPDKTEVICAGEIFEI